MIQPDGTIRYTVSEDAGYQGKAQKIQVTSPGSWGIFIYQRPQFVAGKTYTWTYWYKSDVAFTAEITDPGADNVVLSQSIPSSSQWKQMSIQFSYTNTAANQLRFSADTTGTVWIDNVVLVEGCKAADTDCDGCIGQGELLQYIQQWKSGSVALPLLMETIRIWKAGC
jgi:hypothetical protein